MIRTVLPFSRAHVSTPCPLQSYRLLVNYEASADLQRVRRVRVIGAARYIVVYNHEELLEHPAPGGYLQYLRLKLRNIINAPAPATVKKSTFSDDR